MEWKPKEGELVEVRWDDITPGIEYKFRFYGFPSYTPNPFNWGKYDYLIFNKVKCLENNDFILKGKVFKLNIPNKTFHIMMDKYWLMCNKAVFDAKGYADITIYRINHKKAYFKSIEVGRE